MDDRTNVRHGDSSLIVAELGLFRRPSSRPYLPDKIENGSSRTTRRGLCKTAAAVRIFCRMPLEYDDSVW
jgi:hypothetical protein